MSYQTVFKRYELKYLITQKQKEIILEAMAPYTSPDRYGRSTVRNIYFDTDNFRLIRHSIEKPAYKEKLRIRSYRQVSHGDDVFAELKKKYKSVVYKRRLALPESQALQWLCGNGNPPLRSQISDEIDYFKSYYQNLSPSVFLTYEREAFYSSDRSGLRVTFDENILYRREEMSLCSRVWGTPLLPEGKVLMEIKTPGAIPLWMTHCLTQERIFKTSFSKYGAAYCDILNQENNGGIAYVG